MNDRESWLTSVVPAGADAEIELASLLGTAALVRGAIQAIPVPETAEADSLAALHQRAWELERPRHQDRRRWPWMLGSWLRVVFTLGRRR